MFEDPGLQRDDDARRVRHPVRPRTEMKPRLFRFGVSMATASSAAEWQAKARRAEALGYSALLVPDHLADCLSPWTALTAAATATEELRVGTFVLNNDFRHPVLTAREAATLDLLSGGRLELGLGAGHQRREYDEAGLRFDSAGVRVDRLGESLAIAKALLAGDAVDYEGSHYQVRGHTVWPGPARRPPILVGGNGDRLLTLAAREADIVGLAGFSPRRGGTENDLSAFNPATAAAYAASGHNIGAIVPELLLWCLILAGLWVAGDRTRLRRNQIGDLEERARRTEREAERERRLAAAEERIRIARELHDFAGHAINVILVQAGAARLLHERDHHGARPEELIAAIHTIAAGESLLSPAVTRRVIDRLASSPQPDSSVTRRLRELTPRERDVLELVARGLSNDEIAATLVVEESTVKTHMKRILGKLDLRDRVQAVILAYEAGLVRPGERILRRL